MAFAQVQNAVGNEDVVGGVNTVAATFGSNVTAGSNIYVGVASIGGVAHNSMAGNSNTYNKRRTYNSANGVNWTWWEAQNVNSGATTVTCTFSGNFTQAGILIHEYSGGRVLTQSFDNGMDQSGTSATLTGATATPSVDNCLILGQMINGTFQVITAANGYTKRAVSGAVLNMTSVELIQTTKASTHADGTVAISGVYDNTAAIFMPPALAANRVRFPAQLSAMGIGGMMSGSRIN